MADIIILIILVVLVAVLLYIYEMSHYRVFSKHGIKGPAPYPFVGNMITTFTRGFINPMIEWQQKYGKVYGMYYGHRPSLTVSDLDILREIEVKEFHKFTNRSEVVVGPNPVDKGVFFQRDDDWKRIRTILSPTFSAGKLRQMCPQLNRCARTLTNNFLIRAQTEEVTEVKNLFGAFTMDAIAASAFGLDIDSQKNPNDPFVQKALSIFNRTVLSVPFILLSFLFPTMERLFKPLGLSAWPRDAISFFSRVIRDAIDYRKAENKIATRVDFLQLMLDAELQDSGDKDTKQSACKRLTADEIIGQGLLFLTAGFETVGSALTFAAYALATHPDIQERLHAEINHVVGDGDPTYDDLQRLKYLDQVISETLRMYPPIFALNRQASETVTVRGVTIEKDVMVGVAIYNIHHDPSNYPDPETFDPDRFHPDKKARMNPLAFQPFGQGPRMCIGLRLAQVEMKLALLHVVRAVRFTTCKETQIPLTFGKAEFLKPSRPIKLRIESRGLLSVTD